MRLRTTALIITLALGLLAAPVPAEAQEAGKVRCGRVGDAGGYPWSVESKKGGIPCRESYWSRARI
ncbi:MAG: hypothetical protein ACE5NC_10095 [Anaerolineae bacterium]